MFDLVNDLDLFPTSDSGDFVFTEQLVTFLPDDAFQTVAVQVSLDGILEEVEIFSCSLTVPAEETGVTFGRSATTVTIMDSDGMSYPSSNI